MNKSEAYKELFKINEESTNRLIQLLATSEGVPREVEDYLTNYYLRKTSSSLDFIKELTDKKFYKVINDDTASVADTAKALSSLITHTLIEISNKGISIKDSGLNTDLLLESLKSYLNCDDTEAVIYAKDHVKLILKNKIGEVN